MTVSILFLLASTMYGEAGIMSDEAALGVGHVMYNRALQTGWTVQGFNGYGQTPPERYYDLAVQVLGREEDPTKGSAYVFSFQDIGMLWPNSAACIRQLADWQSELRVFDQVPYRLYAYREWPGSLNVLEAPMCGRR